MRCLLDTHALIWWWLDDPSLSPTARTAMTDNDVSISPVAAIEIAIKVRRGKVSVLSEPLADFDETIARDGFEPLPITALHARDAGLLKGAHRDPFDRLIAAQALIEALAVITKDQEIVGFGREVIW